MFLDQWKNSRHEWLKTAPNTLEQLTEFVQSDDEIAYIRIPYTGTLGGYGVSYVELSNAKHLQTYFSEYVVEHGQELYLSRETFMSETGKDYLDQLQPLLDLFFCDYPVLDDDMYNAMVNDAIDEFITDHFSTSDILEYLRVSGELPDEYAQLDNDGYTVYMSDDNERLLRDGFTAHRVRQLLTTKFIEVEGTGSTPLYELYDETDLDADSLEWLRDNLDIDPAHMEVTGCGSKFSIA